MAEPSTESVPQKETQPFHWDPVAVQRLLAAHAAGGRRAALEAFPKLRPAQVFNAIRRYAGVPKGEPKALLPQAEIRARIAAIPTERFIDRVHGLLTWSPLRITP